MTVRGCLYGLIVVVVGLSLFSGAAVAEPFVDLDPDTDLDGDGTATSPYEITNASELQAMGGNLSANYTLDGTIEAANTSAWNDGAGFEPIGNETDPFTGTFDGNEKTIQDLYINRTTDQPVGLFGATDGALIERVGLVDVDIVGNASGGGDIFLGGLVGNMGGEIINSFVNGTVEGSNSTGGLVGNLNGDITNSYATSSVDGGSQIGGLVGVNTDNGEITTSYAVGAVNESGSATEAGGLVGDNSGTVENSYWDTGTTGQTDDGDDTTGNGLTTERMTGNNATVAGNMDGFAFYDEWIPTASYPELAWRFVSESTGDGSEADPFVVADEYGLQAITANLSASYVLDGDIDASNTEQWNDGAGFEPIANGSQFSGSIDGDGHAIRDLTINRSSAFDVGLISQMAPESNVSNLTIVDATVSGGDISGTLVGYNNGTISDVIITDVQAEGPTDGGGTFWLGALVGENVGVIVDSHSSGSISANDGVEIGGLVGLNQNTVQGSTTNVSISASGGRNIGGFIGLNNADISNSSSNGTISAPEGENIGGFIGDNQGEIRDSNSNMTISASEGENIGGFVGSNTGEIWDSSSSGDVSASNGINIGGLIGENSLTISSPDITNSSADVVVNAAGGNGIGGLIGLNNEGLISGSYAAGNIEGESEIGGLIGENNAGTISESYATGEVTGESELGGLVGVNIGGSGGDVAGTVVSSYATGNVFGDGGNIGGLVGQNGQAGFTEPGRITQSYATGTVSGDNFVGGLVGTNFGEESEISTTYAVGTVTSDGSDVGGLIGFNSAEGSEITESYWDINTTTQSDPADGEGLTTAEITGAASLDNLDFAFNPTWIATDDYPRLVWQVDDYTLSLSDTDIDDGETADSTVTLSLTDGTTQTATEPADYESSDTSVATIDDGGVVTGVDAGSTQITASASGFEDTVSFSVAAAAPATGGGGGGGGGSTTNDPEPEPEPEPVPEPEPEPEPESTDDEQETTEPTEDDEPEEEPAEVPAIPLTPTRILIGGGAGAAGYVGLLVAARTETFIAFAPPGVTQALASAPGAAFLFAEPEQAAFVVGAVALAAAAVDEDGEKSGDESDIAAGEPIEVEVVVENKGDISGTRVVSLSLEDVEDSVTLDLDAHTAKQAVLTYATTAADAGKTLGFTVDCETDATDLDVEVGAPAGDTMENPMTDTTHDSTQKAGEGDSATGTASVTEVDPENEASADVDESELDEGTRTGVFDRIWMEKGKILSYTAGLIIIYIGIQNLENNVYAGGLGLFLGVMALPIVRAQMPTSVRVAISRYGKAIVVIFAALFSGVLIEPQVVYDAIGGLLP